MKSYVRGQRSCVLNQEVLFWFTSIGVQKQPILVDVLAPTRLAQQGSHVQRHYQKRTTLRSKKSCHKRTTLRTLKILLQSICSKEDPHYCFEQSARKLSSEKQQSTYSRVWISLGDSIPRLYCVAWQGRGHARKCQSKDFCEEERYESCSFQRTFTAETFGKRRKRENSPVVRLLPGSHERLASRNPHVLCQKHGGACMMY
jgi:hypothetical protein